MWDTSINHFKSVLVHQFFVKPADRNYFLARWSRINSLHREYHWQASQALEKYFKACLVLNDVAVLRFGHNIELLYETYLEKFGNISFSKFVKPDALSSDRWVDEAVRHFVSRVRHNGQPDGRYGLTSWYDYPDDLFKLDQLSFEIRRFSIGVDWIIGRDWDVKTELQAFTDQPYSTILARDHKLQIRDILIPEGDSLVAGSTLADTFYSWNFPYQRSEEDISRPAPVGVAPIFGGFENSYLSILWENLNSNAIKYSLHMEACIDWLVGNISIGKDNKNALLERVRALRENMG